MINVNFLSLFKDHLIVDRSFRLERIPINLSIKAAKVNIKRNYSYIRKHFKNFPCFEITALQIINKTLLGRIANAERFSFKNDGETIIKFL